NIGTRAQIGIRSRSPLSTMIGDSSIARRSSHWTGSAYARITTFVDPLADGIGRIARATTIVGGSAKFRATIRRRARRRTRVRAGIPSTARARRVACIGARYRLPAIVRNGAAGNTVTGREVVGHATRIVP